MRKIKAVIVTALMCLVLSLGVSTFEAQVQAASPTNVMKAPKAKAGRWVIKSNGYQYRFKHNNKYAKDTWLKIDGEVYCFKSNGYLQTGWKTYKNKKYYFNKQGQLQTGWKKIGKNKYYFSKSTGAATTGKVKIASKYYYFSTKGVMQTGWKKIGKYYYYFKKSNGSMAVNQKIPGSKFYVDEKGRRSTAVSAAKPDKGSGSDTLTEGGSVDIFVGDSRTVGMGNAIGKSSKCIAKIGQGYDWYISTAEPQLKKKLKKDPTATVVINLGVNDVDNYNKYISRYKKLVTSFPKAKIYFMSINPVDSKYDWGGLSCSKMKSCIKKFNAALEKAFPTRYIDCHTYLTKNGFSTKDGIHYTNTTYKKIYNYILEQV